jgi:hypothetical protein
MLGPITLATTAPTTIISTAADRLTTAYYGTNVAAIDPAIISLLMSFLTSLMAGCTPATAKADLAAHPRINKTRIYLHVAAGISQTGESLDVQLATNAIYAVGVQSTVEEWTAYKAAVPVQN